MKTRKSIAGAFAILIIAFALVLAACTLFGPIPQNVPANSTTTTSCFTCTQSTAYWLYHNTTPAELRMMLDQGADIMVVDVRMPEEYRTIHIPGAVNIPLNELPYESR